MFSDFTIVMYVRDRWDAFLLNLWCLAFYSQAAVCLVYCCLSLATSTNPEGPGLNKQSMSPTVVGTGLAYTTISVLEPAACLLSTVKQSQKKKKLFVFFKLSFSAILNAGIWGREVACSRNGKKLSHWRVQQKQPLTSYCFISHL